MFIVLETHISPSHPGTFWVDDFPKLPWVGYVFSFPGRVRYHNSMVNHRHWRGPWMERNRGNRAPWSDPGGTPCFDQSLDQPFLEDWNTQNKGSSQVPGLVQASNKNRSLPVWGLGNAWWVISNSCIFPVFLAFHVHPIAPVGSKMTVVASGSHSWWMLVFCIIEDWRHWKPTTVV